MSSEKKLRKSKKQRFLEYMIKHHFEWQLNSKLSGMFGWSVNQRKNELQREGGIQFQTKVGDKPGQVYYRLVTDPWLIDVENCRRRDLGVKSQMSEEPDPAPARKRRTAIGPTDQLGLNF